MIDDNLLFYTRVFILYIRLNITNHSPVSIIYAIIANSVYILSITLLLGLLVPLASQYPVTDTAKGYWLALSYCLLSILTLWQTSTIVLTLVPMYLIKTESDYQDEQQRMCNDFDNLQKGGRFQK